MTRDGSQMAVYLSYNLAAPRFALIAVDTGKISSQIPTGGLGPICALGLTPDGKGIGVFPCRKATSDIWVVPWDGSSPRQLTHHAPSRVADSIWMFDWSPDGKRLALSRRIEKRDVVILEDTSKQ
jgi:Tol biopolymer transport system component